MSDPVQHVAELAQRIGRGVHGLTVAWQAIATGMAVGEPPHAEMRIEVSRLARDVAEDLRQMAETVLAAALAIDQAITASLGEQVQ